MPDFVPKNERTDRPLENPSSQQLETSDVQSGPTVSNAPKQPLHPDTDKATLNGDTVRLPEKNTKVSKLIDTLKTEVDRLYAERLGQVPDQVDCELIANKLLIWIEGSVTPVDRLLYTHPDQQARSLCFTVDELIKQRVTVLIERHLNAKVLAVVLGTSYESGCSGIVAKLSTVPT